ncbi:hypothetical protein [Streptosporangium sp. NPDC048865]|uniref:hypothetical protein n=1 Tax=Streptosporangium sp. NPDC048865 TaxID=3155766 RepID=UPI00343ADDBA
MDEVEVAVEVVTPEEVAARIGMTTPLTPQRRSIIQGAIRSGLATVTSHLHVSPIPRQFTERGLVQVGDTWPVKNEPLIEVVSVTAETVGGEPTGTWTVVYTAGLDPEADPTYGEVLAEYVLAHASAMPHVVKLAPGGRRVKSSSLEGQSVSYESDPQAGSGAAGAPPSLNSLDHWRRLNVSQAAGIAPHPLDEAPMRWW